MRKVMRQNTWALLDFCEPFRTHKRTDKWYKWNIEGTIYTKHLINSLMNPHDNTQVIETTTTYYSLTSSLGKEKKTKNTHNETNKNPPPKKNLKSVVGKHLHWNHEFYVLILTWARLKKALALFLLIDRASVQFSITLESLPLRRWQAARFSLAARTKASLFSFSSPSRLVSESR